MKEEKKYYPTAFALYVTYFVLGIAATIMGQYKAQFAELWGAARLADGSFNVSGVVAVIAAIGLGRLAAFPVAGPLSDRLGRRISALIGCGLYAVFFLGITFAPNLYVGYVLAAISGMANSFLDTSVTPSCMEIFKEKGTIANIFTKMAVSVAQFLLPYAIRFTADRQLPLFTIFMVCAVLIIIDGLVLLFLPFPPFVPVRKKKDKTEKMHISRSAVVLVCLGFTSSATFMIWMNCSQELGQLYGLADPSRIQSFYSIGIIAALFVTAALLKQKVKPAKILIGYPAMALVTLTLVFFIRESWLCLAGGFLIGFFAAGGVLQLVTAEANEMFPKHRGVITSVVMIASSTANYLVISIAGILTKVIGTEAPRYIVLFNMAITLAGVILAGYLNHLLKKEETK